MAAGYTEVIPCRFDEENAFSEGLAEL